MKLIQCRYSSGQRVPLLVQTGDSRSRLKPPQNMQPIATLTSNSHRPKARHFDQHQHGQLAN
jgi:hypothetical protein